MNERMYDELIIAPLEIADIEAACDLHDGEPEPRAELLWHLHTPYARVLKAVMDGRFVGYACAIAFEDSGWVREIYIKPSFYGIGIGGILVQRLLSWMEEQGAMRQLLIAPEATETFWTSLGFQPDGGLLHYEDGTFLEASKDEVLAMEPEHMLAVLHLDHLATGERREQMLREHMYLGSVYVEKGRVRGFSLPLLGHGLIVADAPEVGLELQRWLLPLQPYLRLPVGHLTAHAHLVARKYTAKPAGLRMVRGERPVYRPQMIYAHP